MEYLIVSVVSLALGIGLTIIWKKTHSQGLGLPAGGKPAEEARAQRPNTLDHALKPESAAVSDASPAPLVQPAQVVVTHGRQEVMSMTVLADAEATMKQLGVVTPVPPQTISGSLRSLIEPLLQTAPSVGTAVMANNRKLMEVVINGQMLNASDGNGLRAIAKAGDGFEHARLYEPNNLQNVANAAAIWQVASVLVAQKHMADINFTLRRLETKVNGIQRSLEEARSAKIKAIMNSLEVARKAIEGGEFLERTRNAMEEYDKDLDEVRLTLIEQIKREAVYDLNRDAVGCEGEYLSALSKHQNLSCLAGELALCNEVRLANWYLCSFYPDNSKMLMPRLEQIRQSLEEARTLQDQLSNSVTSDCDLIAAGFTSEATIKERRSEVRKVAAIGRSALENGILHCNEIVRKLNNVHADRKATRRLIVETTDGAPSAVYLCQ